MLSWTGLLTSFALAWSTGVLAAKTPENYALDPVHTRVAFQVSHAGFSNPVGSFSGSHGHLAFDAEDWSTATVDVTVPVTSLNLGDADWQKRILDRTFFDAKKFPEAHFVSTRVEKTGDHTGQVHGELTLHGITRPVTLAVTLNALKRHPLTLRRTVGFSATATIHRKDFGMDAWPNVVGDEIRLIIEAEAIRSDRRADDQEPAHADP
ncbi:YceI family protein [Arenimonas oryziterrae]|nr:YceI family protein [Arenimonas oryziterrae]